MNDHNNCGKNHRFNIGQRVQRYIPLEMRTREYTVVGMNYGGDKELIAVRNFKGDIYPFPASEFEPVPGDPCTGAV